VQTRERIVITGLGAVSPLGVGVAALVAGLREGRSGVGLLGFEHPLMASSVAAECRDFRAEDVVGVGDAARLPRVAPMALAAAREACAHAGLATGEGLGVEASRRIGVALGTGGGGVDFTLTQARAAYEGRRASLWSITNATHGNLAGELSIRLGLRGPSWCVSTGCASSSDAAGMALEALRSGRPGSPHAMVVIGADAHVRWESLVGMELLRVISTRSFRGDARGAATACRPFDATRDGFVLGEGAWAMVLERESAAKARGARTLGALMGYGATCDAFHRVRPEPEMGECVRAMRDAIEDAGVSAGDVGIVHYHGTGTRLNDVLETRAMHACFGARAREIVGHSVKGAMGHPQGASGLMALVSTMACMLGLDWGGTSEGARGGFTPATLNLRERDPECDLDYSGEGVRAWAGGTGLVLINCLAFGAKNSALVVGVGHGR
jgi:3-oxoacyl-[acyl-carrier-protein] synthase II